MMCTHFQRWTEQCLRKFGTVKNTFFLLAALVNCTLFALKDTENKMKTKADKLAVTC